MTFDMTFQDWTDLDEGWMFGQWESGPWLGFHTKNNSFGSYGWVMANYSGFIECERKNPFFLT